jgi:Dolichyl-phosphate-mannose-protein mannosyltransferase
MMSEVIFPEESRRPPVLRDPLFWVLATVTLAFYVRLLETSGVDYSVRWIYLDEGYRLYPSLRLLRGESLFRDMFTAYPPLSYYLHLLAYQLLGVKVSSVRIVLLVSQLATTTLTYALARHLMSRWFSLFAALLTVMYGVQRLDMGYAGWYALPPMLCAALFLMRWIESGESRRRELLAVGGLVGLAIAIKLRDGAWVAIGCTLSILVLRVLRDFEPGRGRPRFFNPIYAAHLLLPVAVLLMLGDSITPGRALLFLAPNLAVSLTLLIRQLYGTREVRSAVPTLIADLAAFGAGVLGVTAPWIAYFLWLVGPKVLWSSLVSIPVALKDRMNIWAIAFDPLGPGISTAVALAGAAAVVLAVWGPPRRRRAAATVLGLATVALPAVLWKEPMVWRTTLLFVMLPPATGIALLYAGLHWRRPSAQVRAVLVLGLLNGLTIMNLYPSTDVYHWLWASTPAVVLMAFGASRLHRVLAKRGFPLRICVVVGQCALLAVLAIPEIDAVRGLHPSRLRDSVSGDAPMDPASAHQTQAVIDFVNRHVPKDGYVLEIPGSLYCFLTGRRQAARLDYFFVLDSGIWDENREIELISAHDPTYALVRTDFPEWRKGFPNLARFVDATFEPRRELGPVEVLKKRAPRGPEPGGVGVASQ